MYLPILRVHLKKKKKKKKKKKGSAKDSSNDILMMLFFFSSDFQYKSICYGYSCEFHRQVDAF